MLRMVSERARRHYSQGHVQARVQQLAELQQRATAALQTAHDTAQAALAESQGHLWLPPSVRTRVAAVHDANVAAARALQQEVDGLARGFAALPIDASLENRVPVPVEIDQ
jgi:hypothetical protein